MAEMTRYEKLLSGELIEIDYSTLMFIIANMFDINTLSIQQLSEDNYIVKVDEFTVKRYKELKNRKEKAIKIHWIRRVDKAEG
jgi:hypothetical protein